MYILFIDVRSLVFSTGIFIDQAIVLISSSLPRSLVLQNNKHHERAVYILFIKYKNGAKINLSAV